MQYVAAFSVVMFFAAACLGWILDIIKLVGVDGFNGNEVEVILRCIGLIAAPIGAVMGWVG